MKVVEAVGVRALSPDELVPGHEGPELVVVLRPALVVDTADQPGPPSLDGPHQVLRPSRAPAPHGPQELSRVQPGREGPGGEGSAAGGAGGGTEGHPGHHPSPPALSHGVRRRYSFLVIIGKCRYWSL